MSYQVLARKWRPRDFTEMVGQEHVLRALINALDHDRLHHAFLFTGTRGVGKTTVARILAKSLNCEQGVSSRPCGACVTCQEIDEGRFVDLIEVDAASRTKVEDTRELLENVQYAPTRGRYKVYLIDEVHMLSKHSFNALLKTLEEPPAHIKFLLATTDPQRLPVTILSRCLQFNLKRLSLAQIAGHLERILEAESVPVEGAAVGLVARAADGSMRDALSLLDQAIAYGGGTLKEADVRAMLGTVDQDFVLDVVEALAAGDGAALLAAAARAAEHGYDFSELLGALISTLQCIATAQLVPEALDEADAARERLLAAANRLDPETVQLYYQIALMGRRDLPHAPDARGGFEMILLRMLAFRPQAAGETGSVVEESPPQARIPQAPSEAASRTASPAAPAPAARAGQEQEALDWAQLVVSLPLAGLARELAAHCVLVGQTGERLQLVLDAEHAHLLTDRLKTQLARALEQHLGRTVGLEIQVASPPEETPAARERRCQQARREAALAALENDQEVRILQETFDARILPETIQPVDGG